MSSRPGSNEMETTLRFQDVYEENVDFVWRFVRSMGVSNGEAPDVAQEVFLVVHQRLSTFEGRSSLRTWVAGITVNAVRSYRRRRATRALGTDEFSAHEAEFFSSPDAERLLESRSEAALVLTALREMTELQREAFLLVDVLETPAVEAAAALETNENTLRARLRAARSFFSKVVLAYREGHGPEEAVAVVIARLNR